MLLKAYIYYADSYKSNVMNSVECYNSLIKCFIPKNK